MSRGDIATVRIPELNDRDIRQALILKLRNEPTGPRGIIEELWVHDGQAIADVVALEDEAHCYEIKGCNDKVERILVQGTHYNACFRRITLVTTDRGLPKALRVSPVFWGIIVAQIKDKEIRLHHVRLAKNNPNFTKQVAVLTLWKQEMLNLLKDPSHYRKPRETLARLIAATKGKIELSTHICEMLLGRQRTQTLKRQDRNHVRNVRVDGRLHHGRRATVAA